MNIIRQRPSPVAPLTARDHLASIESIQLHDFTIEALEDRLELALGSPDCCSCCCQQQN